MHSVRSSRPRVAAAKRRNNSPDRGRSGVAPWRRSTVLLGVVLVVATVGLYYPTSGHPFANCDDDVYVTGNRHVKAGLHWETAKWAATSFDECNWHPLTWMSHALDYQLFGLDPSGHHTENVLWHVLNALLLYWVLLQATGSTGPSFAVAALFALHPINVESVAWIAERKNLLSLFLFLLALGAYRWYARAPQISRYCAVAGLYVLALTAKPQVITFPFLLLLWDYWPLRRMFAEDQEGDAGAAIPARSWKWLELEKLPLLAFSAASAVITVKAQRASGSIHWLPFFLRAENAVVAYALYVGKAVWPSRLGLFYPHPRNTLAAWQVVASALFLLIVTAWVIKARRRRYLLVGWFWFLGSLVPMIGLVQVGEQAMADRYAYLSFIGLFIMLCWGVSEWAAEHDISARWLAGATAAMLLALAVMTHYQIGYWEDNVTLWQHALEITKNNWFAENNLGAALLGEGRDEEAITYFRSSAAIYPDDPVSHLDIGYYEKQHGNLPLAMAEFNKVLVLAPKQRVAAEAYNNIGFAYLNLRDTVNAKENFQAAVKVNPQHNRAWIGLGVVAQREGNLESAAQDYSRSIQAEPYDIAYLLLAQALTLQGEPAKAQAATEQARLISPNFDRAQKMVQGLVGN